VVFGILFFFVALRPVFEGGSLPWLRPGRRAPA